MTEKPAKIIGVDKGTMTKGEQADVTIIDPNAEYKIDVNKFRSKSKNCPYHGWKVKGRVEKTIVSGEIRFSAED
jgi:dihydroorotase